MRQMSAEMPQSTDELYHCGAWNDILDKKIGQNPGGNRGANGPTLGVSY